MIDETNSQVADVYQHLLDGNEVTLAFETPELGNYFFSQLRVRKHRLDAQMRSFGIEPVSNDRVIKVRKITETEWAFSMATKQARAPSYTILSIKPTVS
jgi:hypothetical protein